MTSRTINIIGHNLHLVAEGENLISCKWTDTEPTKYCCNDNAELAIIEEAVRQITEYLEGQRTEFSIPTQLNGSGFRMKVWEELKRIPYGETITYSELAKRIGNPKAYRAVANACGANPCPVIIPCHRVVASGGKPGGYTGGIDIKYSLLGIEKQNSH